MKVYNPRGIVGRVWNPYAEEYVAVVGLESHETPDFFYFYSLTDLGHFRKQPNAADTFDYINYVTAAEVKTKTQEAAQKRALEKTRGSER